MSSDPQDTTHFGYQKVKVEDKSAKVAEVFHSVASRYDIMNDVMSFGIHRMWKRFTVDLSGVSRGDSVLDIAGGTGDLAAKFSRIVGDHGSVILADINQSMLQTGRAKMIDRGLISNLHYVQANAENLSFTRNSFDCISIAFGLRNVTHIDKALGSMYECLKPGGRVLILEFSKPVVPGLSPLYDAYSFKVLPKFGQWIAGDSDSYQYLAESIRMHPDQRTLLQMMQQAGFEKCEYFNLSGGIVALHRGFKF